MKTDSPNNSPRFALAWLVVALSMGFTTGLHSGDCDDVVPVLGGEYQGDTSRLPPRGDAGCVAGSLSSAVVYSYTAIADGNLTISTCGSIFDTVLSLHEDCLAGADSEIACNDDSGLCGVGGNVQSHLVHPVQAGGTYYIRIGGYDETDKGHYYLQVAHDKLERRGAPGAYETYNNRVIDGVQVDTSDATFLTNIDFRDKTGCQREVIWETGGGWIGSSLCYEGPNKLVLRSVAGQTRLALASFQLPGALVDAGAVQVGWAFDMNPEGEDSIYLLLDGVVVSMDSEDLSGDWSGSDGAGFGVVGNCLPADGAGGCLPGVEFSSGDIDLEAGLNFYPGTLFTPGLEDVDGDGIYDGLELKYAGGDLALLGDGDFDGDGVADSREAEEGTDPTDPDRVLVATREVTISDVTGHPGGQVTVSVNIDESDGLGGFRIELHYDSASLTINSAGLRGGGALTGAGGSYQAIGNFLGDGSVSRPGHLVVAGITTGGEMSGPGVLLELDFHITAQEGLEGTTSIQALGIHLNEFAVDNPDCAQGVITYLSLDTDGDGDPDSSDCAPNDPSVYDGALESCDLIDSDCDGSLSDDFTDTDSDGVPDCADPDDDGDGFADDDPDECNPLDGSVHIGAEEACDEIDSNCNGDLVDGYPDSDGDGTPDCIDLDGDGDGVDDDSDNCPETVNENQGDLDADGAGDVCDQDDDNDGVVDGEDNCSLIANPEQVDTDRDGAGDSCDDDDDGDGVPDSVDNCDQASNEGQVDSDGDGVGDACDFDGDNDGVNDPEDNCLELHNPSQDDSDSDGLGNLCDPDDDNDGIVDGQDNCPLSPNGSQGNSDSDEVGDACDEDDDNDAVLDAEDNCPRIANLDQVDTDKDGLGNACDPDDDGDGVVDNRDNCPLLNIANQDDSDGDGVGDSCDTDNDNDGVGDGVDNCPGVFNPDQSDTSGNGNGDACDPDDDADGLDDEADNCPLIANGDQLDTDGDGVGDLCELDDDGDGVVDESDNCPGVSNPGQGDTDGDSFGDACDLDDDGDQVPDTEDNCLRVANQGQADIDEDGIGDACDEDADGDGIPDLSDNCPGVANSNQVDSDDDGIGDSCDEDRDNDGVEDTSDNCPVASNPLQEDTDSDGVGDACDGDDDGDKVSDFTDNCPYDVNPDQSDSDNDGIGDFCDDDADGDGVPDGTDNCPGVSNGLQEDGDGDALGDACDPDDDNDGLQDSQDNCPTVENINQIDSDGDGSGDECDADDDNDNDPDSSDCEPLNPAVHREAVESCDAIDSDCDGSLVDDFTDTDGDGSPDCVDEDDDADGSVDDEDCDPLNGDIHIGAKESCDELDSDCDGSVVDDFADTDVDDIPDCTDVDDDGDGVLDVEDNCPLSFNPGQEDADKDGVGDSCDLDGDNDSIPDGEDNCVEAENPDQADGDGDGIGDVCDNCPFAPNAEQADGDGDGTGDLCEAPVFAFGFSGVENQEGCSGDSNVVEIVCVLISSETIHPDGAQAFSFGVSPQGGVITAISTDGSDAVRLFDGGFQFAELASGEGNEGAVCGMILSFEQNITLSVSGASSLATLTVESAISEEGLVNLAYTDGLSGDGQPVRCVVTWRGETILPILGEATYSVLPDIKPPGAPVQLVANAAAGMVALDWEDGEGVVFYSVYRDAGLIAEGLSASEFTDNAVENGTSYTYSVIATSPCGVESDQSSTVEATPEALVVRGDSNGDAEVNISDPTFTLQWLFLGGGDPVCLGAADSNGDGEVNISDPTYTLSFLFLGGPGHPGIAGCDL